MDPQEQPRKSQSALCAEQGEPQPIPPGVSEWLFISMKSPSFCRELSPPGWKEACLVIIGGLLPLPELHQNGKHSFCGPGCRHPHSLSPRDPWPEPPHRHLSTSWGPLEGPVGLLSLPLRTSPLQTSLKVLASKLSQASSFWKLLETNKRLLLAVNVPGVGICKA